MPPISSDHPRNKKCSLIFFSEFYLEGNQKKSWTKGYVNPATHFCCNPGHQFCAPSTWSTTWPTRSPAAQPIFVTGFCTLQCQLGSIFLNAPKTCMSYGSSSIVSRKPIFIGAAKRGYIGITSLQFSSEFPGGFFFRGDSSTRPFGQLQLHGCRCVTLTFLFRQVE